MCKVAGVAEFKVLTLIFPEGTDESQEPQDSWSSDQDLTRDLPNTKQECYQFNHNGNNIANRK
jgi:hypothetical protein